MFCLLAFFLPYFAVSADTIALSSKSLASLLSPVSMSLGLNTMLQFQSGFIPLTFSTASIAAINRNYSLLICFVFMALDIFLYGVLAWYLDAVFPNEFGQVLPWYFPCSKSFWLSQCDSDEDRDDWAVIDISGSYNDHIERVSADLSQKPGVHIKQLRKEFPNPADDKHPFVAVKGLNMSMYQGQCFVLLGHNGAGKSTIINTLTGMYYPTSGSVSVYGRDLTSQMPQVRKIMGVCPQHDVLFPSLTAWQHLQLYAQLKGVPAGAHCDVMVTEALSDIQFSSREVVQEAGTLSGGQKRRLCLAIALIADSKVCFLDEPTSGGMKIEKFAYFFFMSCDTSENSTLLHFIFTCINTDQLTRFHVARFGI